MEDDEGDFDLGSLRSFAEQAASAFAVVEGPDHRISYANSAFRLLLRHLCNRSGPGRLDVVLPDPAAAVVAGLVRIVRETRRPAGPVEVREPGRGAVAAVWSVRAWPLTEPSSPVLRVAIEAAEIGPRSREVHLQSALEEVRQINEQLLKSAVHEHELAERARAAERELLEANRKLGQLAYTDELTGLHNSRYFWSRLREEHANASRNDTTLAVVLFDLDDFKQINDEYGHLVGDAVLALVGRVFRRTARQGETVARVGGEEIALLLRGGGAREAAGAAGRIRREIERNANVPDGCGGTVRVTASAGAATTAECCGVDVEELYVQADRALYAAKRAGRNRVAVARGMDDTHVLAARGDCRSGARAPEREEAPGADPSRPYAPLPGAIDMHDAGG